jgi:hypothetical protein
VAWISTELWIGTPHHPVSQTRFVRSHKTSEILPDHQGILYQSVAFLTFLGLCTECLGHHSAYSGPFPCSAKIIKAQNRFLVQERRWPNTPRPQQQSRGMCLLPWGKGFLSTSPGWNYPRWSPKLLEVRPPKTTGVTIKDTEKENCLSKAIFTSAEECAGTWAQHTQRGRQSVPPYIPDMTDPASWPGLGQFKSSQSSRLAEILY